MDLSRRSVLKAAASAVVVLTAGGGAFVLTRSPDAALAPWRTAGGASPDVRLRALSYAILAPNPHNRQPWIVDLRRPGEALLRCDPGRLLPETDPHGRQIVIGLGCFLELARMAAAEDGHVAEVEPFPEGMAEIHIDARPIARVRFRAAPGVPPDPLFRQVLARRSNKEPYDTARPVADASLAALAAAAGPGVAVGTSNDRRRVEGLRAITWRAMETELATPRTYLESVRLMRIGKAEIEANPDGIDLGGPFLETLSHLGVLTRERLADPASSAYEQGLDMFRAVTGSAMAHVWVSTEGNSRTAQLAAGAAWVRINLAATGLGLGIHPLSQALQEYAEVQPHNRQVHAVLGAGQGTRLQMLGRLGYGPQVAPSPRWPLAAKVRPAKVRPA